MQYLDDVTNFLPQRSYFYIFFSKIFSLPSTGLQKFRVSIDINKISIFSCPVFLHKICYAKLS